MGRRISNKERAATDAALELLKTTKNQKIKAQLTKLLLESDAREKARVDAREKQRRKHAHDKKLVDLSNQVEILKKKIQKKDDLIESEKQKTAELVGSAETDAKDKITQLKDQVDTQTEINGSLSTELKNTKTQMQSFKTDIESFIVGLVAYRKMQEYNPTILDMALGDRIKTEVSEEDQAKAGKAIAMLDPEFRELQNDLQTLENLKREKRAPMELFKVATEGFGDTKSQNETKTALKLLYDWTEFSISRYSGSAQWWEGYSSRIRELKRRTEADILTTLQFERAQKLSKEQLQALVKEDNGRADKLSCKLQSYEQCSNCLHVSHTNRTKQGRCQHCGQIDRGSQGIQWSPLVKTDIPTCIGSFPCKKDQ